MWFEFPPVVAVASTPAGDNTAVKGQHVGLKVGTRLRAQNSSCEVIVVKGSDDDAALLCGGVEMVADAPAGDVAQLSDGPKVELGKRYTDDEAGVEVLCTKAGVGPLSYGARELTLKTAQALPASD